MKLASSILAITTLVAITITGGNAMAFEITSFVFGAGGAIPARYSCDGPDLSPPLAWREAPAGTKSFALIVDDPDAPAGTWVHWVVWNIPPSSAGFPEGMAKDAALPDGAQQGISDFRRPGWGGPCPPSGTHRYFFKLFALDAMLELPSTTTASQLEAAMKDHVLAEAKLMGTFSRKR